MSCRHGSRITHAREKDKERAPSSRLRGRQSEPQFPTCCRTGGPAAATGPLRRKRPPWDALLTRRRQEDQREQRLTDLDFDRKVRTQTDRTDVIQRNLDLELPTAAVDAPHAGGKLAGDPGLLPPLVPGAGALGTSPGVPARHAAGWKEPDCRQYLKHRLSASWLVAIPASPTTRAG